MKRKLHTLISDANQVEALDKIRRRITVLGHRQATKKYERTIYLVKLEKELEDLINEFVKKAKEAKGHEIH